MRKYLSMPAPVKITDEDISFSRDRVPAGVPKGPYHPSQGRRKPRPVQFQPLVQPWSFLGQCSMLPRIAFSLAQSNEHRCDWSGADRTPIRSQNVGHDQMCASSNSSTCSGPALPGVPTCRVVDTKPEKCAWHDPVAQALI